jgi:hypothetical protein
MEQFALPVITVNILSWNRRAELAFILSELMHSHYPKECLEIIVVDNASHDGSAEMVRRQFPGVKLIALSKNIGIAGWNRGFAVARGEYIMVLDDDAYPERDAFGKITRFFQEHPKTGILNCGVVKGWHKDGPVMPSEDATIIIGFWGGCSVIRAEIIKKVGGYDEQFFIGAHEFDFAVRALDQDWHISYAPEIKVFHKAGGAYYYDWRYIYYTTRNKLWVTWKYFPLYAILTSNIIWIVHSLLLSMTTNTFKGYCLGLKDALAGMRYLRQSHPRRHMVNPAVTRRLLRRFSLKVMLKGINYIFASS